MSTKFSVIYSPEHGNGDYRIKRVLKNWLLKFSFSLFPSSKHNCSKNMHKCINRRAKRGKKKRRNCESLEVKYEKRVSVIHYHYHSRARSEWPSRREKRKLKKYNNNRSNKLSHQYYYSGNTKTFKIHSKS